MASFIEKLRFKRFIFRPKIIPIITSKIANKLLNGTNKDTMFNFQLGRLGNVKVLVTEKSVQFIWLDDSTVDLDFEQLKEISRKETTLFGVRGKNEIFPLEIRDGHYYKLKKINHCNTPTLEIDGIHMHRVKDVDPWTDSMIKVRTLGNIRNKLILDICTGLGYTAIIEMKRGAKVITIELDKNVLKLAEYNPWSFELRDINIINEDASKAIERIPSNTFDAVVHDPPRFSLAGELYSQWFYDQLYRILKRKGKLFHYTGLPSLKYRKKSIVRGIGERLTKSGFKVRYVKKAQGFFCLKT